MDRATVDLAQSPASIFESDPSLKHWGSKEEPWPVVTHQTGPADAAIELRDDSLFIDGKRVILKPHSSPKTYVQKLELAFEDGSEGPFNFNLFAFLSKETDLIPTERKRRMAEDPASILFPNTVFREGDDVLLSAHRIPSLFMYRGGIFWGYTRDFSPFMEELDELQREAHRRDPAGQDSEGFAEALGELIRKHQGHEGASA